MIHKLRPLIALIVIGSIVGGGYYYFSHNPEQATELQLQLGLLSADEASGIYKVSGYIEAETVTVAAEQRGRIAQLLADEGDWVQAGQPIAMLDTALLEAQLAQAEAKIQTAEANLAKVKAGLPAEDIAKAEAAVAVAQARADAAESQWRDAIMLRDNPQELDMQIDAARTALELADLQITANIPRKDASETMWELGKDRWHDVTEPERKCLHFPNGEQKCITINMPEGVKQDAGVAWNLAGANMWEAWVDLNTSFTARDDAETRLNDLLQLRNDPQAAQVQVAQAKAAHETALAEVAVAEAQLEKMEAGPRTELVSVAQAQVAQTEAALAALDVARQKSVLVAPLSGSVVDRVAHEGEMALPGVSLLTLADLTNLTLVVYVPEPDVGLVKLGQTVNVLVDSFPGEPFPGTVTFINDKAEFTPKNVQTKEERVNTVFAVKISLQNSDGRLKPGMPADAILADASNQSSVAR